MWEETQYLGYYVNTEGQVKSKRGNLLKPWLQKRGGYPAVKISLSRDHAFTVCVHTLVLTTFVGPKPEGSEACHRNGDPTDNRLANLYWGTRADNVGDMYRHGTWSKTRPTHRGEAHHSAQLTDEQVADIRNRYVRGINQHFPGNGKELAEEYGVSYGIVWAVATGRTWSHV
jgi:hypothetical protein